MVRQTSVNFKIKEKNKYERDREVYTECESAYDGIVLLWIFLNDYYDICSEIKK